MRRATASWSAASTAATATSQALSRLGSWASKVSTIWDWARWADARLRPATVTRSTPGVRASSRAARRPMSPLPPKTTKCTAGPPLGAHHGRGGGIGPQAGQLFGGQGPGTVPVRVHDAEEAKGFVAVVDKLVGRVRRHVHHVKGLRGKGFVADDDPAAAPQRHDDVDVGVLLQRRVAARPHFKVAHPEAARLAVAAGYDLAGDVPPAHAGVLPLVQLVLLQLHAVPAEGRRVKAPEKEGRRGRGGGTVTGWALRHRHMPPVPGSVARIPRFMANVPETLARVNPWSR